MIVGKWNYERNDYEPYRIPDKWVCQTFEDDMNAKINCAHCGKKLKYGDSYSSLEIHDSFGLAFAVCEKCYNAEWLNRTKKIKD
jgi:hypothetical protein